MRIVHLTPLYHPSVGGFQAKIRAFSERLVRRGHQVTVVTTRAATAESFTRPQQRHPLPAKADPLNGVAIQRVRYFPFPAPLQYLLDDVMHLAWSRRLWMNESLRIFWLGPRALGMLKAVAKIQPDIILTGPLPFATPYTAQAIARHLRIPCALIPCLHPGQAWAFDNRLHYSLLSHVDAVLPSTHYEADWARSMGAQMKRVEVLGDGVDPEPLATGNRAAFREKYGIPTDETVVLFLGRKEHDKGALHLLDAANRVTQKTRGVTFLFAGPSGDGWSDRQNRQEKVIDIDRFDDEEKPDLLAAADIVALPSRAESTGLVFLEAWACGKPVIGCRTGPVCEIVSEGVDGLLVPFGAVDELATAITTLAANEPLRRALGEAGRKKIADKHDWDRLTDTLEAIYQELIEAPR